jgi:hypothetical protein
LVSIISVRLNVCLLDLLSLGAAAMAESMYAYRPVNNLLSSYGGFPEGVKPTRRRMRGRY